MARSTSDEEIKLRKRARRRLIGAIAITTLVVVMLPMILDSEPRPIGDDVAVQIPSPNAGPYAPKAVPVDPVKRPSAEAAASATRDNPAATAKASGSVASAAAPGDLKIAVAGAVRPPPDTPVASAVKPAPAAVPALQVEAKPLAAPAANVAPVSSSNAPGVAESPIASARSVENFVIQLGAFADVDRAKERHALLVKAGVRSYTEVIRTPSGDKTRVRAGPFPSREAADKVNERLKTLGVADGVVVPRRY